VGSDDEGETPATERLTAWEADARRVRRFRLVGLEGPIAGKAFTSAGEGASIGSHERNDIVVEETSVSRFHCELTVDGEGVRVRDLGSKNGTLVDGMRVIEAWLRPGAVLRLGRTALRFELGEESNRLALSTAERFGTLVGRSPAMRATFALLEKAATSDVTVLLEGETGTGKEGAAESLHQGGARRDAPFLVLDCGAVPANLLESELFGHERGAFTGAVARRRGIFEEADGGTVFLDEIGELQPELQPKLLRVLERREIRRVGGTASQAIDVRVIAATHRDLRAEVNAGRFRADLYFRLAVLKVPLPSLRQRPEDIPLLVERFLGKTQAPALQTPEFLAQLQRGTWPGNVRELRNFVERCLVMEQALSVEDESPALPSWDATLPYATARERAIAAFERGYLEALLDRHEGNVARAAQSAGMNKVYLYRLLHRHGLMPG
jgi:two-component system, NtrC family, response regulator GlrR